ncbi:Methylmalonate semialdehyde dehydrogenase [acylating] [Raoultella terrigena]|uniref:Methylmalonate semialdehyde dehydrogenase [acylating] n=1 Tax=Raoultella terrigena TaxID=577 RepID=A0A4U9D786_RAOTE|nr:Methylmalonate semialdehyde dehydrogenase [acylating] [Raoultella terrigena]
MPSSSTPTRALRRSALVGSSGVAEYIYKTASAHGKRVQPSAQRKNHAIVMPDADLDATVNAIMGGAFGSAGRALHGAAGGGLPSAMKPQTS